MGILNMALEGNYKRFYNNLKEISAKTGKSPVIMFIDTAISTVLLGSGLQDYLNYRFYEKSFKERKTYVTIGYMAKAYEKLASIEYADFMSDKTNFHKNYSEFTRRNYLAPDCSYEEFEKFISENPVFIMKPIRGLGGSNVKKIVASEIPSKEDFFKKLKADGNFIEQLIIQDSEWAKLSPNSVNTIRIVTTIANDEPKIVFAGARIGNGTSLADNFHQGGQGVLVDIDKGVLTGNGINKELAESEFSPNNIKFDGFKIPYWEQIKEMVLKASKVNPNIHIVGWDVAISENGPLIIEGNRGPGFDLIQVLYGKGTKYILEDLKKELDKK